jgi:hypothetical protein
VDSDVSQRHDVPAATEPSQADLPPPLAAGGVRITHRLASDALDDDGPPTVERAAWLRDDDYWRKVTYMSATGRQAAVRPATRPLPRPDRFNKRSPLRSIAILLLVIALIICLPIGVVTAERMASQFVLPGAIPGINQPTEVPATHTPPVKPTATPRHKK